MLIFFCEQWTLQELARQKQSWVESLNLHSLCFKENFSWMFWNFFNVTWLWISLLFCLLFHLSVSQYDKCYSCSLLWWDFWLSWPEEIWGVQVPLEWGNLGKKNTWQGKKRGINTSTSSEFPTWAAPLVWAPLGRRRLSFSFIFGMVLWCVMTKLPQLSPDRFWEGRGWTVLCGKWGDLKINIKSLAVPWILQVFPGHGGQQRHTLVMDVLPAELIFTGTEGAARAGLAAHCIFAFNF